MQSIEPESCGRLREQNDVRGAWVPKFRTGEGPLWVEASSGRHGHSFGWRADEPATGRPDGITILPQPATPQPTQRSGQDGCMALPLASSPRISRKSVELIKAGKRGGKAGAKLLTVSCYVERFLGSVVGTGGQNNYGSAQIIKYVRHAESSLVDTQDTTMRTQFRTGTENLGGIGLTRPSRGWAYVLGSATDRQVRRGWRHPNGANARWLPDAIAAAIKRLIRDARSRRRAPAVSRVHGLLRVDSGRPSGHSTRRSEGP
jgi:hypothetical protein